MADRNDALAALVAEAGCTEAWLAGRVNALAAVGGVALTYDYSAVYRWIEKGQKPRKGVARFVAAALSERLGRRISPADFGMGDEASLAERGLTYSASPLATVETVLELGRADVKRRTLITKSPYLVAALAIPSRDWLLATLDEQQDSRGPRKVGMQQVEGIREMFRHFQEMDVMRGGGHARIALVQYMDDFVMPLLRQPHPEEVGKALYEAASEQCYLVGWMAYDDGQHGLAERYLIQSLRLAQASGNAPLGAHVLAGMSDQANLLGHPKEAISLAKAGQHAITADDSPACLTDLYVLEARAQAVVGNDDQAARAVGKAETLFERIKHENEPEWARFIDRAYVFGEAAHTYRDLGFRNPKYAKRGEEFATESLNEATRQRRARRGSLSYAARALTHLQRSNAAQAGHEALQVLNLAGQITSSRTHETIRDLSHRFKGYESEPEVAEFIGRARTEFNIAA
ncbi:hypothetical protein [Actinomadura rupiterrae]|uniref:hypothetical protein n=1 Tax=Actinomadura rupiterrae TaxID=559627 RepID=UPI0020A29CC3|nr:hypothetical protein [Actinomadura rupiterrae]MCP2337240.1 hypothetical protein [Actinomadura rupiterrae]